MKYSFIPITPRSTMKQGGNACLGPIYESYRFVFKLFVFDWNIWWIVTCNSNYLLRIIIIYLRPYNFVEIIKEK